MSAEATRALRQAFRDEYGRFSALPDGGARFVIDGRGPEDTGAGRRLFSWFCLMLADVAGPDTVRVTLGGVPADAGVAGWLAAHGARATALGVQFDVGRGGQGGLAALADAVRAVAGQPHGTAGCEHACRRVGGALDRLREVLDRAWP